MDSTFLCLPWKELITIIKRRQKEFPPLSPTDWAKPGKGSGVDSFRNHRRIAPSPRRKSPEVSLMLLKCRADK